ncbi:class I SAM-dependent methyltransferase [Candidatus Berkelbacteria bacterium]|nr:class I SAM-dependent methyltransferase [Candidatus Berkelbacteria bacterium]
MARTQRVRCNLCGAAVARLWYQAGEFTYVTCQVCNLHYLNPQPTLEILVNEYYTDDAYFSWYYDGGYTAQEEAMLASYRQTVREIVYEAGIQKGQLLDIGCGSGYLMVVARELGFEVEGIEPGKSVAEHGHKKFGLKIHIAPLEEVKLAPESYDLVVIESTLEHMLDPFDTLKRIARILRPGGVVFIKVPNANVTLTSRAVRASEIEENTPFHTYYFTPQTLSMLTRKVGLWPISLNTALHFSVPFRLRQWWEEQRERRMKRGYVVSHLERKLNPKRFASSPATLLDRFVGAMIDIGAVRLGTPLWRAIDRIPLAQKGHTISLWARKEVL